MRALLLLLALAAACSKSGSLVVVTVTATPPIIGITSITARATVGAQAQAFPIALANRTTPVDFAIELPPSIEGQITVAATLLDPNGGMLATGEGSTTIKKGERADLTIAIGQSIDMATDDMAASDGGVVGPELDLLRVRAAVPEPARGALRFCELEGGGG